MQSHGFKFSAEYLSKIWKPLLGLFLLSIVLTSTFSPIINQAVEYLLPMREVTIHAGSGPIYISDTGFCDLFDATQKEALEKDGWIFHPSGEDGYAIDTLLLPNPEFREYVLYLKEHANAKLTFWANISSDKISISTGAVNESLDLYSDQYGGDFITIFPFQDSKLSFFFTAGFFFVAWLAICLIFFGLFMLFRFIPNFGLLTRPASWRLTLLLWAVFFLIVSYQYVNNQIPNFLVFGDQLEYWTGLWEIGPNLTTASEEIRYWNGYLCFYIPYLCRIVGSLIHVDPAFIWFFLNTGFIAVMCGYSIPQLYLLFTKKQAMCYQVFLFSGIYTFFWVGTLSGILMDAIGMCCFLLGVVSWFRCWCEKPRHSFLRPLHAIIAGASLSAAVSFRTVYLFGVFVLITVSIIYFLVHWFKKHLGLGKNAIFIAVCSLIAFFVIAFPQLIINQSLNVSSFFPVSNRDLWHYGLYDRSLSEYSMDMTLSSNFTGHPHGTSIEMASAMKDRYYNTSVVLTMSQELDLFIQEPLEAISYIVTKFVVAFDTKTNECYPDVSACNSLWYNLFLNLFSFINYLIIGSALYTLICKYVNRRTILFLAFTALSLVFPHTWTHIEWRYYIIGYILFYFLFSYYFCSKQVWNYIVQTKGTYFLFISLFTIGYFAVSMNIWYFLYMY